MRIRARKAWRRFSLRPLPLGGEMIIEDLTDEEEQAFYDAIDNL
jgi:hypothetical protein